MKKVIIGFLVLGSLSSFAADAYRDCGEVALEVAKEATKQTCIESSGEDLASDYKLVAISPLHDQLEGTLAQVSYYCEAGQGLIVLLEDNRWDIERNKLLCKRESSRVLRVGAWE